jgi:hypothetical protein
MTKTPPPDVEIVEQGEFVEVRYLGDFALARFKRQMEQSAKACLDRKLCRLLVNLTALAGYSPVTFERHQIGALGAELSRNSFKVAVLGTKDQITSDQFTAQVARNRGATVQTFVDRGEALTWLLAKD